MKGNMMAIPKSITLLVLLTSAALAQRMPVVFHDDFSDNFNRWPERDDTVGYASLGGNSYVLQARTGSSYSVWKTVPLDPSQDFDIECRVEKISGVDDGAYGLEWGDKPDTSFAFMAYGDGAYEFDRNIDGHWSNLYGSKSSSHVNQGNSVNELDVTRTGDQYLLFVNGACVDSADFVDFASSHVGFFAADSMRIAFEEITVRQNPTTYAEGALPVIFHDDFSDNHNGWEERDDTVGYASVAGDSYVLESRLGNGFYGSYEVWKSLSWNPAQDFEIVCTVEKIRGAGDKSFGLEWGDESDTGFLVLHGDGSWRLSRFTEGSWSSSLMSSEYIKQGDSLNQIVVRKTDDGYRFFVNGAYLGAAAYDALSSPGIGLYVSDSVRVAFKGLTVRQNKE
jgi:hypothetical protein